VRVDGGSCVGTRELCAQHAPRREYGPAGRVTPPAGVPPPRRRPARPGRRRRARAPRAGARAMAWARARRGCGLARVCRPLEATGGPPPRRPPTTQAPPLAAPPPKGVRRAGVPAPTQHRCLGTAPAHLARPRPGRRAGARGGAHGAATHGARQAAGRRAPSPPSTRARRAAGTKTIALPLTIRPIPRPTRLPFSRGPARAPRQRRRAKPGRGRPYVPRATDAARCWPAAARGGAAPRARARARRSAARARPRLRGPARRRRRCAARARRAGAADDAADVPDPHAGALRDGHAAGRWAAAAAAARRMCARRAPGLRRGACLHAAHPHATACNRMHRAR
jgi:hypothetical protein